MTIMNLAYAIDVMLHTMHTLAISNQFRILKQGIFVMWHKFGKKFNICALETIAFDESRNEDGIPSIELATPPIELFHMISDGRIVPVQHITDFSDHSTV